MTRRSKIPTRPPVGLALVVCVGTAACLEDDALPPPRDAALDAPVIDATDASAAADVAREPDALADVLIDATVDAAVDVIPDATVDRPDVPAADAPGDVSRDGGFFGPSRCATAGVQICEDFEGDAGFDHATWTPYMTNGTLEVDTARAARGGRSLHIRTTAMLVDGGGTGANVGLRTTRGFPPPMNTYFGRAFVWMAHASPTTHTTLFESGGVLPGSVNASQRFSISGHSLDASYDTSPRPPTTDYARRSATTMPLDRWACLEWEFKGDTNELHFWLDEVELADMAVLPTRTPAWTAPPAWTRVNVGLQLYRPDAQPVFDLWLDEVAIDTARVGCRR